MKSETDKQISGFCMLLGLGLICLGVGGAFHWWIGVGVFGFILLAIGALV